MQRSRGVNNIRSRAPKLYLLLVWIQVCAIEELVGASHRCLDISPVVYAVLPLVRSR